MRKIQYVLYGSLKALQDEAFFEQQLQIVSEQRRAKVLRCRHREDQIRSLGAGILVIRACEELGITEEELEYLPEAVERDMTGKYYCNVTHAGHMAAVVISSVQTGIDLEGMGRFAGEKGRKRMEAILRKIGTPEEKERLKATYAMALARKGDFTPWAGLDFAAHDGAVLWTRKEAYAKASGLGLGMDFSQIDTDDEKFYSLYVKEEEGYVVSVYPACNELEIEECTMN